MVAEQHQVGFQIPIHVTMALPGTSYLGLGVHAGPLLLDQSLGKTPLVYLPLPEGCVVTFVIGCGLGVLLCMLFVFFSCTYPCSILYSLPYTELPRNANVIENYLHNGQHRRENEPDILKGKLPQTNSLYDICNMCGIFYTDKLNKVLTTQVLHHQLDKITVYMPAMEKYQKVTSCPCPSVYQALC